MSNNLHWVTARLQHQILQGLLVCKLQNCNSSNLTLEKN